MNIEIPASRPPSRGRPSGTVIPQPSATVISLAAYRAGRAERRSTASDDGAAPDGGSRRSELGDASLTPLLQIKRRSTIGSGASTMNAPHPYSLPIAPSSRKSCLSLGASTTDVEVVSATAIGFTTWRLHVFRGRGDMAWAASAWTRFVASGARIKPADPPRDARETTETAAVRWALARFANLLAQVPLDVAITEAVTIPLQFSSSAARDVVGAVPGTVSVKASNAAEFKVQRIFARRIATVDRIGCPHDGWLTVPEHTAALFGWEVMEKAW